jgi:signal transduction histidine kinase
MSLTKLILFILLTLNACTHLEQTETIKVLDSRVIQSLQSNWKFKADHHPDFKLINLDDSDWKEMPVPGYWRLNGYLDLRHAWYRKKVFISEDFSEKNLGLFVPGIFEGYEIYFNEQLIGSDGETNEEGNLIQSTNRINFFTIPANLIHTNQENLLSLHVMDQYNFGAITGTFYIGEHKRVRRHFLFMILKSAALNGFILLAGLALFFVTVGKKNFFTFFLLSIILIQSSFFISFLDRVSGWIITDFMFLNFSLLLPSLVCSVAYILVASFYFKIKIDLFGRILIYISLPLLFISIITGFNEDLLKYRNFITLPLLQLYALFCGIYCSQLLYKALKAKEIIGIWYIAIGTLVLLANSSMIILGVNPFLAETMLSFSYLFFFFCIFYALSLKYAAKLKSEKELALNFARNLEAEVQIKTEKLSRSNKELEDANKMRDRLFSIIGHDLRSPLDALKTILNLFNDKKLTSEQIKHHSIQIMTVLENSQFLLENLLNWASTQLGYKGVIISEFDLIDVCKEVYKLYSPRAKGKNIQFKILAEDSILIQSDRNIIQMVLNNLVSNAIKFTDALGEINIKILETRTHLEISVIDTGIGIWIDEAVFLESTESYLRPGTANEKASGIGLQLCKAFLEKIDSKLFYEKNTEGGSIFSFYLKKSNF